MPGEHYVYGDNLTARFANGQATFPPGLIPSTVQLSTLGRSSQDPSDVQTAFLVRCQRRLDYVQLQFRDEASAEVSLNMLTRRLTQDPPMQFECIQFSRTTQGATCAITIRGLPSGFNPQVLLDTLGVHAPIMMISQFMDWLPHKAVLLEAIRRLVNKKTPFTSDRVELQSENHTKDLVVMAFIAQTGLRLQGQCSKITGLQIHPSLLETEVRECVWLRTPLPRHSYETARLKINQLRADLTRMQIITHGVTSIVLHSGSRDRVLRGQKLVLATLAELTTTPPARRVGDTTASVSLGDQGSIVKLQKSAEHMRNISATWLLDTVSAPPCFHFTGTMHALNIITNLITRPPSVPAGATCAICEENSMTVHAMPVCSHHICQNCLFYYCKNGSKMGSPLRCFQPGCSELVSPLMLAAVLSTKDFDDVLNRFISKYLHQRTRLFMACVGPDCPAYLPIVSGNNIQTCLSCATINCTACRSEFHPGLACAEVQAKDDSFDKALSEQGGKRCPECSLPIMKSAGCDHIRCPRCEKHLCWQCLQAFDSSSDTYSHLSSAHGVNYIFHEHIAAEAERDVIIDGARRMFRQLRRVQDAARAQADPQAQARMNQMEQRMRNQLGQELRAAFAQDGALRAHLEIMEDIDEVMNEAEDEPVRRPARWAGIARGPPL